MRRPLNLLPPCGSGGPEEKDRGVEPRPCPKIPKDSPQWTRQYAIELSDRNWRAYQHYKQCKATGYWPETEPGRVDGLVAYHASLIEEAEEAAREFREERRAGMLHSLVTSLLLVNKR